MILYTGAHFWVDLTCACWMAAFIPDGFYYINAFLLYNFCAFALQVPLGYLADGWNRNGITAAAGGILVLLAGVFQGVPLAMVLLAGIGNALFHVGAGIDILNGNQRKIYPLGIFVSSGALGLYLGKWMAGRAMPITAICTVGMLLFMGSIVWYHSKEKTLFDSGNARVSLEKWSPQESIGILLLFAVVFLRSFVGCSFSFPWQENLWYAGLLLAFAAAAGKAIGGYLADWQGISRTTVLTLGGSLLLYGISDYPPAGIVANLLFQATMPLTLWLLVRKLQGSKGFAFGLLTFALFLGYLPRQMGYQGWLYSREGAMLMIFSSMLLLLGAFYLLEGRLRKCPG